MPSAFTLRLRAFIYSSEQIPACSPSTGSPFSAPPIRGSYEQNQAEPSDCAAKPREFLLPIREPEKVSLGDLANLIKDHWRQLYPTEDPLQINKLLNDAYPTAVFTVDYSVADVWVDSGRREREGFDQNGTVRVIQVASSSTPTRRAQRASSVFQDIEGAAARVAKRKPCDGERDTNGSSAGTAQTAARNPFQIDRETDMSQGQSKKPRLAEDADPQSPSPAGVSKTTKPIPVFYNDMSAPSFAHPRGHRRHLSTTSTGSSPEKGLGLGITASPIKPTAPNPKVTSNGSPGSSAMPPPPTPPRRRSLCGRTNSPPLQSFSQDDTPLGAEKPLVRKPGSVRGKTSSKKSPQTRPSQRIPGSGKESHRTTPSTGGNSVSKKKHSNDEYEDRDRKEFQEVKALLKGSKTNPECLPILKEMSDFHKEILGLKANSALTRGDRYVRLKNVRRNLTRRRVKLEPFRRKGELLKELEVHSTSSEDESTERKTGEDEESDEESLADLFTMRPKRPPVEQRDLPADAAVARRVSSLRGHSKSAGIGDNQHMRDGETPDGNSLQAGVKDTGSERVSLPVRTSAAPHFQSPGLLLDDAPSQYGIADESDDPTTDSEGDDIPFEPTGIKFEPSSEGDLGDFPFEATGIPFEPSSVIHNSNVAQKRSPISRPVEAELTEHASGDGVDTPAKILGPSVTRLSVSQQQPSDLPTLRDFIQMPREEALALLSPFGAQQAKFVDTSVTSEDETSDDSSEEKKWPRDVRW